MIFPELPKRYQWIQHSPELANTHTQTPLHMIEEPTGPSRITVEEWWIQHGLAQDPAALPKRSPGEKIDWLAKDAWEFYFLIISMIAWIAYWYGVHMGVW